MHANSLRIPRDDLVAVTWYTKAANQGHAGAQCNLGIMHANRLGIMHAKGRGVHRDDVKAVKWYMKAADQGHAGAQCNLAEAQFNVGIMHAKGHGVPRDDTAAVDWLTKAAEQGHADAQCNLGAMSGRGGVTKEMADHWNTGSATRTTPCRIGL
jgi:TPR repeat protein